MGRRGPPRTPLKVLESRDSPLGKERKKRAIPPPPLERPERPEFVRGGACKYWRHVVDRLAEMGVLARIDRNVLGRYCTQLWLYERAVKVLHEKGETTLDHHNNICDRVEVKRVLKLTEGLLRIEKEFGMTASARSSLLREAGGKPKKGDKDRFFERRA